jgi:DNA-binding PadR family transcriptional regulator
MPRKAFDTLSEPMFYVLMALRRCTLCGVEIVDWIGQKTDKRVVLGPGTLYTILAKLTEEDMIREISAEGRRRNYQLTEKGRQMYETECDRLRRCLADAEVEEQEDAT